MFLGPKFIAWLRTNEVGQFVRPPGLIPEGHAEKQGTPTMGGLLIIVATALPFIILSSRSTEAMLVLFATLACGAIGFVDDFMKIVKKRSLGLSGRVRMVALVGVAADAGDRGGEGGRPAHHAGVPVWDKSFEIGAAAFFVIVFLVVAGAANAVNLTDGLDGLAAGHRRDRAAVVHERSPSSPTSATWRSSARPSPARASGSCGSTRSPPPSSWATPAPMRSGAPSRRWR